MKSRIIKSIKFSLIVSIIISSCGCVPPEDVNHKELEGCFMEEDLNLYGCFTSSWQRQHGDGCPKEESARIFFDLSVTEGVFAFLWAYDNNFVIEQNGVISQVIEGGGFTGEYFLFDCKDSETGRQCERPYRFTKGQVIYGELYYYRSPYFTPHFQFDICDSFTIWFFGYPIDFPAIETGQ